MGWGVNLLLAHCMYHVRCAHGHTCDGHFASSGGSLPLRPHPSIPPNCISQRYEKTKTKKKERKLSDTAFVKPRRFFRILLGFFHLSLQMFPPLSPKRMSGRGVSK